MIPNLKKVFAGMIRRLKLNGLLRIPIVSERDQQAPFFQQNYEPLKDGK